MTDFTSTPFTRQFKKDCEVLGRKIDDLAAQHPVERRPCGNNADEWTLWFFERAGYGAQFLGVQIAEAIDEHIARSALLDRSQAPRILLTEANHGVCVGGRWDGWLMWKHPDGQWVTVRKLETEDPPALTSHERKATT